MEEVAGSVFINSGILKRVLVAKRIANGTVSTPDVEPLINELKNNIVTLTVDPFVRVHNLAEDDNDQIDDFAAEFAHTAHEAGCAISLVHHTRKSPARTPICQAVDMDSGRVAAALNNAARVVHALTQMSKKNAEELNINPDGRV